MATKKEMTMEDPLAHLDGIAERLKKNGLLGKCGTPRELAYEREQREKELAEKGQQDKE